MTFDVAVVGAGIIGLASALNVLDRNPALRVVILDKEPAVAVHQSGHNSGVIHSGIYYAPGSLKARLCTAGRTALLEFCAARGVEVERCGKVIVAVDDSELPALRTLYERGIENGISGLEWIGPERLAELEPHVRGVAAILSPETSIVDFKAVCSAYADVVRERGGEIRLSHEVTNIREADRNLRIETKRAEIEARCVVTCAGLQSDRVAAHSSGTGGDGMRILPFRGDYYTIRPARRELVKSLIYPVPDPRFPFLGVHFTKRVDGDVWAGPNAVLAFAREGYRRTDLSARDLAASVFFPGFWRLAARYWRTGMAEMYRDVSKPAFVSALQRYLPELTKQDLVAGPSGVRAQALRADGTLVDDFVIDRAAAGRLIHVRNAPSPAATSSLAIGALIADQVFEALDVHVPRTG